MHPHKKRFVDFLEDELGLSVEAYLRLPAEEQELIFYQYYTSYVKTPN
jgi:hypothetical protein